MIFLRVLSKNFLWPHYSGAPARSSGARFIEPPEPPVPTPPTGRLPDIIDCHWHRHTARKERSADGEVLQETCSRQQLIAAQPAARLETMTLPAVSAKR